jgi:hypothetical protein
MLKLRIKKSGNIEGKINTRYTDENLSLIEQKFNAIKSKNTKKIDSIIIRQDSNIKSIYLPLILR